MAAAPAMLTIAAELPALTTRDVERWLQTLSATERAELKWFVPGLKAELDRLIDEPLTREVIDAATSGVLRVILRCRRMLGRVTRGDAPFAGALFELVRARRPQLLSFLGSAASVAHLELVACLYRRCVENYLERVRSGQVQMPDFEADPDDIVTAVLADPAVGILHAEVLLFGVLECADRKGSAAQGRELARLAVTAATAAAVALRRWGFDLTLEAEEPEQAPLDHALAAMVRLAFSGPEDSTGAGWWVASRMPQRAPAPPPQGEAPRFRKRLVRVNAEVTAVSFGEQGTVTLRTETEEWYLCATPELVERALQLRGAPVEAVAVVEREPSFWPFAHRLVRLDRASEEVADPATRTQDILRDWDELLHRLAQ